MRISVPREFENRAHHRPPFLGFPGWRILGEALLLGTAQTLVVGC